LDRASHDNKVLIASGIEDVYGFRQRIRGDPAFYDENSLTQRMIGRKKSVNGCHEKDQECAASCGHPEQGLWGE
jgi:hypothetical protein